MTKGRKKMKDGSKKEKSIDFPPIGGESKSDHLRSWDQFPAEQEKSFFE